MFLVRPFCKMHKHEKYIAQKRAKTSKNGKADFRLDRPSCFMKYTKVILIDLKEFSRAFKSLKVSQNVVQIHDFKLRKIIMFEK